nr:hypothetical protein CoNPh38_CDS0292 [Staphylococcus phage S-CoN_Ph38]
MLRLFDYLTNIIIADWNIKSTLFKKLKGYFYTFLNCYKV